MAEYRIIYLYLHAVPAFLPPMNLIFLVAQLDPRSWLLRALGKLPDTGLESRSKRNRVRLTNSMSVDAKEGGADGSIERDVYLQSLGSAARRGSDGTG